MKNQVIPQQFAELNLSQLHNTTGGNIPINIDLLNRLFGKKK